MKMDHRQICLSVIAMALSVVGSARCYGDGPATAPAQKAFLTPGDIDREWAAGIGGVDSLEVMFCQTTLEAQAAPHSPINFDGMIGVTWFDHRIEEGEKFHVTESKVNYDGSADWDTYDGVKSMEYTNSTRMGSIMSGTTGRNVENNNAVWQYLLASRGFPGRPIQPCLFEELLSNTIRIRPQLETVNGESCHVLECAYFNDTYTLWIAHNRGMLLMKYTQDRNDGTRLAEMEVWTIGEADTGKAEVWYPKHAHWISSHPELGRVHYDLQVDLFKPNVPLRDNAFDLIFPAGTLVWNRIINFSYTANGASGEIAPARPQRAAHTATEAK